MYNVWFGLCSITNRLLQEAGALKACCECASKDNNIFLQICEETLSRQLLLNIAKVFDSAETCGYPNCSILQLHNCFSSTVSNNANDSSYTVLSSLEKVQQTFDLTISKKVRNKKLAHFDFEDFFAFNQVTIAFQDLEMLIEELVSVLSTVAAHLSVPHYSFISISEYSHCYTVAIRSLSKDNTN